MSSCVADVAFAICCFLDVRQSKAPNRLAPLSITRRTFLRLAAAMSVWKVLLSRCSATFILIRISQFIPSRLPSES